MEAPCEMAVYSHTDPNDMTMMSIHGEESLYLEESPDISPRKTSSPRENSRGSSAAGFIDHCVEGREAPQICVDDCETRGLNDTFEKSPPPSTKLNETFDRDHSSFDGDNQESLKLQLDNTGSKVVSLTMTPESSPLKDNRSGRSLILKRRSDAAELGIISPKRTNMQNTPRAPARRSTNLLHESEAFDFTVAAETAASGETYGTNTPNLFVVNGETPKFGTPNGNPTAVVDNIFARKSFIAMFDPISNGRKSIVVKKDSPLSVKSETESPRANQSLLIKGLPEFPVLERDEVDESPANRTLTIPDDGSKNQTPGETEALKDLIFSQTQGLRAYEQATCLMIKKLSRLEAERTVEVRKHPDFVRLLGKLDDERRANKGSADYVRSMESSIKHMLEQLHTSRDNMEQLRKTIIEQQESLRDAFEARERAANVFKLKLQVNDSENEHLRNENALLKSEINNLRSLVQQFNPAE